MVWGADRTTTSHAAKTGVGQPHFDPKYQCSLPYTGHLTERQSRNDSGPRTHVGNISLFSKQCLSLQVYRLFGPFPTPRTPRMHAMNTRDYWVSFEVGLATLSSCSKPLPALSGNGCTEYLGPEEPTLGSLDDLLVDAARRVVHYDGSLLVIDLSIHPRVPNQIDNPLLALILAQP